MGAFSYFQETPVNWFIYAKRESYEVDYGRFDLFGKVIIQTYNPTNYVYTSLLMNNYEYFYNLEMDIRRKLNYPPYYYICDILVSSTSYDKARDEASKIKRYLDNNLNERYKILGPSVSGIVKLKNKYRFNIMIKYRETGLLYKVLSEVNKREIKDLNIDINMNI